MAMPAPGLVFGVDAVPGLGPRMLTRAGAVPGVSARRVRPLVRAAFRAGVGPIVAAHAAESVGNRLSYDGLDSAVRASWRSGIICKNADEINFFGRC